VTPAKNEEENLPNLIESLAKQTIKPGLWVIVDDGSEDETLKIVKEAQKRYPWIKSLRLNKSPRDLGIHYAEVCKRGFRYALNYCKEKNIPWDYIALFDADIILDKYYIEKLIKEFEKNSKLGLASGHVFTLLNGKEIPNIQREDLPEGGCRLWRRRCFEATGGYYLTFAPDSVSIAKAKMKGWKTRWFSNIKAYSSRPLADAEGYWKEYKGFGIYSYYVNLHPFYAFLKGLRYFMHRPYYIGMAFLYGYFVCAIKRMKKIEDEEIKNYYWKVRPKEMREGLMKSFT
jgi:glycosyltransferase involved in cell wall biosynthesis